MAIGELLEVVPAPDQAVECGHDSQRDVVQTALGLMLPQDYIDLAQTYGSGIFWVVRHGRKGNYVWVFNPLAQRYLCDTDKVLRMFRKLKDVEGGEFSYNVHPDKPGLFPWATDADGCTLSWFTAGPPDEWPIVAYAPDHAFFERFDMPVTSFLAMCFTRKLTCHLWTDPPLLTPDATMTFETEATPPLPGPGATR
jgi:hypothetical protein